MANKIVAGSVERTVRVPLVASDAGGGVLSWKNPEQVAIDVRRLTLDFNTVATGACTIDAGVTAVSAATSSNNLITGCNAAAAVASFDNITDKGVSGKEHQRLAKGGWVTATKATGATAGLAGFAIISYVLLAP
jgi:hypothetical protein